MTTEQRIFRKVSLERLSSPDQLDQLMRITDAKSWLAFLALAILLAIGIYWSIVARIPIQLSAPTILLPTGGIKNLITSETGQITELYIDVGQEVEEGQLIAHIRPLEQSDLVAVHSLYKGRILEVKSSMGNLINAGDSLASLEFTGNDVRREAVIYLSPVESRSVTIGMPVQLTLLTGPVRSTTLSGKIIAVSDYPVTRAGVLNMLGSEELMQSLVTSETPIEVRIDLDAPADEAANKAFKSGILASATILVGQQRPIDMVIPLR